MMKHRVCDLEGELLDAAVAMIEGIELLHRAEPIIAEHYPSAWYEDIWRGWSACRDWRIGGPIIERERIDLAGPDTLSEESRSSRSEWRARIWGTLQTRDQGGNDEATTYGPTPLIAAMRAYVASKLGEEVELP
jgi:hypothetical protein